MEKRRANARRYVARHKAEHAARHKAWAATHREYLAAYARKRRSANPEHQKAVRRTYYQKNIEKMRWEKREYRKRNPERTKEIERRGEQSRRARMMTDAVYYAKRRATHRISQCKAAFRKGKIYRPRFQTRIPDWMVMGQPLAAAFSPYLVDNQTRAQFVYSRDPKEGRLIYRHSKPPKKETCPK